MLSTTALGQSSPKTSDILLFKEPGDLLNIRSFKVIKALDRGYAIAEYINRSDNPTVLLWLEGEYFYDNLNGMNAWDYVLSERTEDQPWAIAGILSCIKKGYNLNSLMD